MNSDRKQNTNSLKKSGKSSKRSSNPSAGADHDARNQNQRNSASQSDVQMKSEQVQISQQIFGNQPISSAADEMRVLDENIEMSQQSSKHSPTSSDDEGNDLARDENQSLVQSMSREEASAQVAAFQQ